VESDKYEKCDEKTREKGRPLYYTAVYAIKREYLGEDAFDGASIAFDISRAKAR
jgi:hypothetical protein